jgi:hypothetical protein
MLNPVYIIACEGLSEDRATGLVTIFQVTEQIVLNRNIDGKPPQKIQGTPRSNIIRVIAVWMHDDEDKNQEFDYQFVAHAVDGTEITLTDAQVVFGNEEGMFLKRFTLAIVGVPEWLTKTGKVFIEHRMRRSGQTEWSSQRFPFMCLAATPSA